MGGNVPALGRIASRQQPARFRGRGYGRGGNMGGGGGSGHFTHGPRGGGPKYRATSNWENDWSNSTASDGQRSIPPLMAAPVPVSRR